MKKSIVLSCLSLIVSFGFIGITLGQSVKTISGKVTGTKGVALQGATVSVKNSNIATVTGADGTYSISLNTNAMLIFTYVGYRSQEFNAAEYSTLNVSLSEEVNSLNDVVVVGYTSIKRKELAGAVSTISPKSAGNVNATNVASLMIGKAAGVQVLQGSGTPGQSPQIVIRSAGSLTKLDPLYVIDGIQSTRDLFGVIPPQDIEDITVLKDAAYTAIYGAAGANGVVVVTTKKGRVGTPKITVNAQYGVSSAWKTLSMMNASQYIALAKDYAQSKTDNGTATTLPAKFSDPAYLVDSTNYQDELFRRAKVSDFNFSISGGNDKSNFHFFSGYNTQDAITGDYKLKRLTNRLVLNQTLGRFSFGETITLRNDWTTGQTMSPRDFLLYPPYKRIEDANILGGYSTVNNGTDLSNIPNPLVPLRLTTVSTKGLILTPQVHAEVKLVQGLRFRSQATAGFFSSKTNSYQKAALLSNNISQSRTGIASVFEASYYTLENVFNYEKRIGSHGISFVAGQSYINEGKGTMQKVTGTGYLHDSIMNAYVAPTKVADAQIYYMRPAVVSYFGRINYNYANKYIIAASYRRDGSSTFDPDRRWGSFPGIGLAWRFSEERFSKNFKALSDGKLRVGWGRTGNNTIPNNAYIISTWTGANPTGSLSYPFGLNEDHNLGQAVTIAAMTSPLVWETTDQNDIGLDLAFLNNRLSFTFDWYNRSSKNLLTKVQFPNSGFTFNNQQAVILSNASDVVNKGIEVLISYQSVSSKPWQYNISVNGAFNKNKVTKVGNAVPQAIKDGNYFPTDFAPLGTTTITRVGDPIGSFYGYRIDHVAKDKAEVDALNSKAPGGLYQKDLKAGDMIFRDLNGDGIVDARDQEILGSPLPDFVYGFNAVATYKNFDLNIVINGVKGVELFKSSKTYLSMLQSTLHNASTDLLDRWRQPGDVSANPRVGQNTNQNLRPSDWYIENGNYMRLRNISLGYTFKKDMINKLLPNSFNTIRLFVSAQNLVTITKYTGYDPEVTSPTGDPTSILNRGVDAGVALPQPKTIMAGLQIGF